jgi:UDP-glucose 4-epimerase
MTGTAKTAVVTGGAGFIGSHMVDLLIGQGCKVRVIDNLVGGRERNIAHHGNNPRLSFEAADIRDFQPGHPVFAGVDYVFHFAGIGDIVPSIERPAEYMSVNVQGTVHMLECARAAGAKRFVYAASSSCYGLASTPTAEDHPIAPLYPYALSKYQGEQAALHWHRVYRLPINSIRIFNAYGTRSRTSGAYGAVFGVFLKQKLAGKPFTVVGDGTQTRDFDGPVVHIPKRPGEPDCTFADIAKIKRDLRWQPKVTFEEGVGRVLSEIDYWREAPLWEPESIAKATEGWFTAMSV